MKIKRTIIMQDGTESEMEFELTPSEVETAYREQESNYYHMDVISFLESECGMEEDDAERVGNDIWEFMYDDYLYNSDCNLSYWDNMQNAYDEVTKYECEEDKE